MKIKKEANDSLVLEAEAFNKRATERKLHGFIPDLRANSRNEYFYKSFWRDPYFTDLYMGKIYRKYLEYLRLNAPTDSRILDFGCGQGFLSLELARAGYNVVGVDISNESIKIARDTFNVVKTKESNIGAVEYHVGDEEIVKDLGKFDVILTSGVLHHLENINNAVDIFASSYRNEAGLLMGHEPQHNYFTKNDAVLVAVIRELLSLTGSWYESPQDIQSFSDLEEYSLRVFNEYVTERDQNEEAQSPNDLEFDRDEILVAVERRYKIIEVIQSSSFIYRLIGGIRRPSIASEHKLAAFLDLCDQFLVKNGALNANYFFLCARVVNHVK